MSSWARFFADRSLWWTLGGLEEPNAGRSEAQWHTFWSRYRKVCPKHPIFQQKTEEQLRRTAAVVLHGDEGRSLKKSALMVLSCHSLLGKGSGVEGGAGDADAFDAQRLNFLGHTLATRWLLAVLPRHMYADGRAGNFQAVLAALAEDARRLCDKGVRGKDGVPFYLCVLHVVGDWPFLQKAFQYTRGFGNSSKRATTRGIPKGICHICRADQPGYPFEDFSSAEPRWRSTEDTCPAYSTPPPLLQKLLHEREAPSRLAAQDLFHGWHLGAGKVFVSSCIALLADFFPARSMDGRFELMTNHLRTWARAHRQQVYIRKLTRDVIGWPHATEYPTGGWSKGSTTLALLRWVIFVFGERRNAIDLGSLVHIAWLAATEANAFFSGLYRESLWIARPRAQELAGHGLAFLHLNGRAAKVAHDQNRPLFLFMPNLHRLHHIFFFLKDQAANSDAEYALSPLAFSCQLEEDFVGRPSRISRRVDVRTSMARTLERVLMASYSKFVECGWIVP